ncbi:MAG: hypothetical protein R2780_04730 [Crocinitomicaceae bacterium]|nr:hypothetical protein [Crocinitomicaceae bacterium]
MTIKYKFNLSLKGKLLLLLLASITVSNTSFSQIVGGEIEEEKDENSKDKMNRDSLSGTTFYLTYLYNWGSRKFEDNSPYNAYAEWEEQKPDFSNGVTGGVFLPVSGNLMLDLGVTFFGHKEQYTYDDPNSDSTFSYTQSYIQLGMPLKLRYAYGDKFQIFGFAGVTPVNILNVRYISNYTTALGTLIELPVEKHKEKLSQFNLMTNVGVGFTYNMDWIGITFYPEYRQHLFNTYNSQKPVYHRMYGIGLNAGLTLRF